MAASTSRMHRESARSFNKRNVNLACMIGVFFFFQAEDGIRDYKVTGVQTCALPISTPTECVFVIITGPHRNPDSSTQVVPVISPLPFMVNQPANTGSSESLPRGKIEIGRASCRERV